LFAAQLLNHLSGIRYVLALTLLAAMFNRYEKFKPVIVAWLLLVAGIMLARLGSRTELVMMVLASAMMYHALVRPLSPRIIVLMGSAGLAGFLVIGAVRSGVADLSGLVTFNPFRYGSEFESLFANAVHLNRVKDTAGELPWTFYLADLTALIPQQLAPFTKIDRANWYVATFFPKYAAAGGGLAFGVVPEAIVTGGWMSALALGAALGICFARVHRFYVRHSNRFWVFVFYVWIATLSYLSFRNGTFALLVHVVYRFLPAVLLVHLLGQTVRRVRRAPRPADVPGAVEA
jgi:oligosaccharide repeat unit polymerase